MRMVSTKNAQIYSLMNSIIQCTIMVVSIGILIFYFKKQKFCRRVCSRRFSVLDKIPAKITYLRDLVEVSDDDCKDQLTMDRAAFHKLCHLLQSTGGLSSSMNVTVAEKVAMFLSILAHHTKNRCIKFQFKRSCQTVSKHFHVVLNCVLRLHNLFLVTPQHIPDDSTDQRWCKFKGCLGALDGTYVDVHFPTVDKVRYRNRKGQISINVLGVVDTNMKFVYVLTGWESSATDSRVLRDAINRTNDLKVPRDPLEDGLDEYMSTDVNEDGANNIDIIKSPDTTPEWTAWRDNLAQNMWNEWNNLNGV
ncbi:hypothetical protein ACS0TY_010203 [Phlomoides rotata]